MKAWILLFLQLLALAPLASCKFTSSPYGAETPKLMLNEVNLARIKAAESETGPEYKVALIADTHNYYSEFEDLVDHLNSHGPFAMVIVAGDITNLGHLEEFNFARRSLNRLRWPFLVVPGNHDLISNGETIFRRMFGNFNFELRFKDSHFIFLNSNNWEVNGLVPDLSWLEERLRASVLPRKLVVSHVGPVDEARFSEELSEEWIRILREYGVDYQIHGHNHGPEVGNFDGVVQITIGAPVNRSYFELDFSGGGVTHQKVSF